MSETKSEPSSQATPYVGHRLLEWIHERVAETKERGSIFISIENSRITWINYEKNVRLRLPEGAAPGASALRLRQEEVAPGASAPRLPEIS